MLVCDSLVLSDSLEAALHVVNKRHPSLLYSLTISCDRGGTHARAQMSRGVLSGQVGSTYLSLAGCPPNIREHRSPPVQTLTGGRHAHLAG